MVLLDYSCHKKIKVSMYNHDNVATTRICYELPKIKNLLWETLQINGQRVKKS